MSILDLSKSLIDAVNSVMESDSKNLSKLNEKILKQGLDIFNATSIEELSELDQKKLSSWIQRKLQEESCGVCKNVDEESSAQDIVKSELEKMGKSLGELSPEEKKALFNKVEVNVKAKNESINEVLDLTSGTEEEAIKRAIDDFLKSDAPQFKDKSKDEIIDMAVAAVKQARGTSKKEVKEGIETEPEDVATNGAVGVTDPEEQMPVAVDVIKEVDTEGGDKREVHYRLFVQFNVNDLPKIVPPPSLPGAKSIEDLRDLVSGLPYYGEKVEDALTNALDILSEASNVVSENFTNIDEGNKVVMLGGTSGKGGHFFLGDAGIKKMIALSKKNPEIEYTISSDNYTNFKRHWLKNGKFAKQTVANANFDFHKNAVRPPKGKDVTDTIFKVIYK